MIYRRSKTVEVEHEGVTWTFNRPPGSVLLGWAPQVAELSKAGEGDSVLPITPKNYLELLSDLAEWVSEVDGVPTSLTGEQLDSELLVGEGLGLWAKFFLACQSTENEKKRSEKLSA